MHTNIIGTILSYKYLIMKNLTANFNGVDYTAPAIKSIEVVAERGFEASMPGVNIAPWETEEGTLEF